jgi:hypothetical protein
MNVKTKIIIYIIIALISLSAMAIRPVYVVTGIRNEQKGRVGNPRQNQVLIKGKLEWRFCYGR